MNSADRRVSPATLLATVLVLIVVFNGCRSGHPPSPTPSATPSSSIELRYRPVDQDYCAEARLSQVLASFDLVLPTTELSEHFESAPGNDPPSWVANCQVGADGTQPGLGRFAAGGNVFVWIFGLPADLPDYPASPASAVAQAFFENEQRLAESVISSAYRSVSPTVEPVAGWWDEGVSVMATRRGTESPVSNRVVDLGYVVYDDNLLIRVMLHAEYPREAEEAGIDLARRIAVALTERAAHHVPLNTTG